MALLILARFCGSPFLRAPHKQFRRSPFRFYLVSPEMFLAFLPSTGTVYLWRCRFIFSNPLHSVRPLVFLDRFFTVCLFFLLAHFHIIKNRVSHNFPFGKIIVACRLPVAMRNLAKNCLNLLPSHNEADNEATACVQIHQHNQLNQFALV